MNMERCKPEYRSVLAAVLMSDPSARRMFKILCNLGAKNMRPDYTYSDIRTTCKCGCGNSYLEMVPVFTTWFADCRGGSFVAMKRYEDGWTLHS